MIKVKNLKKSFNNKPILKGISCEFEKGKTSLIIGQTGSGKTVFLKCLLGLHTHDEGQIIFNKSNLLWSEYLKCLFCFLIGVPIITLHKFKIINLLFLTPR